MTMQSMLQELRVLKQDEMTLINLASKISDQLNRLKVEELALQNLVRLQNEEQERLARGTDRSFLSSGTGERPGTVGSDDEQEEELDLSVGNLGGARGWNRQEEEEEEEEEDAVNEPNDIEEFVEQLM